MRRNLLLSFIITLCIPLLGNPVDEITAKQLAQNFWKENHIMAVKGNKVFKEKMSDAQFVNIASQCGYSEFYIFNNEEGKGFVIIAADDCVTPVLGYSYDNNFATENLPHNLKDWLDSYAEQIRAVVIERAKVSKEIQQKWDCLKQGQTLPIRSETTVNPLIATHWNQNYPYNNLCPADSNAIEQAGGYAYAGCVATAMAQIMKYWTYPEHGTNSHSYIPEHHPEYGTQFADFSTATYQWATMPYNDSSEEIAQLIYHCGVSVEMDYGPNGSFASTTGGFPSAEQAYKTFFDYKTTLHSEDKLNHSDSEWISILKTELNAARPIHYRGANTDGGHSFICDGYDNSDLFHFNWGWSGNNDGYYYINTILYPTNQRAIIGIEPNNPTHNYDLAYSSPLIMSHDEYRLFDEISVYAEVINNGSGAFNGYIGAGVYHEETPGSNEYYFLGIMDYWDRTSDPLSPNYLTNGDLDCEGGPPYIPGSYATAMLYSMDGLIWNAIDFGSYDYAYFDISYSSFLETNSDFTIVTDDSFHSNTDATVNVDILNVGSESFYGKLRVSLANSDGSWVQNIGIYECNEGLPTNSHYINGLDFMGTITAPSGTYLMELAYQETGSTNWYYAGASDYQNPVWVYVAPEPIYADIYEPNDFQNLAYPFTPTFSGNSAMVNTTGANLHNSTDVDYYKINLNAGYDYTITPRLYDASNNGHGNSYSVNGLFAYSTDGVNWSDYYDDAMTGNFSVIDGGTVYFNVSPFSEGDIGTYLLSVGLTRIQHLNNYTISVSANPSNGGIVTGGGTYNQGSSCTVHATANNGYSFVNWTENGAQVSTVTNYSFTVTGNRNLVANFAQNTHTIQATADTNGSITPSGSIAVAYGANQSFSMIPDSDYEVQEVFIDGNPIGSMTSYTFTNVTTDHHIHVTFSQVNTIGEDHSSTVCIYPNPTQDEVTIKAEGLNHVRIIKVDGQTVYNADVEKEQVRIDLSNMAKGLYMIHIDAASGQIVKKVVVK